MFEASRKDSNQACVGLSRWFVGSSSSNTSGLVKQKMPEGHSHTIAAGKGLQGSMPVRLAKPETR